VNGCAPRVKRRRFTQAQLAVKVGLSQSCISDAELGDGGSLSIAAWQRMALVLGIPLRVELGRDPLQLPEDAGHLDIQELVLRLGREIGCARTFELATRPEDPTRSTDVGLTDDTHRRLLQIECVNTFGKINAAIRSSDRKRAEAEQLAVAIGHGTHYTVHTCWVIRSTRRNRALLARYPELFSTRFPGSSRQWIAALTKGAPPPERPGLVWCDMNAARLFEWRH
jgi:transcriptional regulator with XRE-family HTH domain